MKIRHLLFLTATFFSVQSYAQWYQQENINWWILVYAKLSCEEAKKIDAIITPTTFIEKKQCEYVESDSTEGEIAILSCENVDMVFTTTKESCEKYLAVMKEILESQESANGY